MVELTASELQQFQLTYNQLNLQNQKTKWLFQSLITNGGKMVGFQRGKGKLLIEVYPAPLQGCTIYCTNVTTRGKRYHKTSPTVFTFETCEDLLQGVACFGAHHPKSEAYRYGDRYLLILHSPPVHGLQEFAGRFGTDRLVFGSCMPSVDPAASAAVVSFC